MQERKLAAEQEEKNWVIILVKRYGEAIKASITPMGPHMLDVVLFFRHIESVFDRYRVPNDLKAALLQPYRNDKSRYVVFRIDPSLCNDYAKVRDAILREHKYIVGHGYNYGNYVLQNFTGAIKTYLKESY